MNTHTPFAKSHRLRSYTLLMLWSVFIPATASVAQPASAGPGWYLTNYVFKDGSREGESVLAGTASRMKDRVSFTGDRGNIQITQNRTDITTGKLLAGVTYQVTWSEPPEMLRPQEKAAFDFGLRTVSSTAWKAPQQSAHINQAASTVYFVAPDGAKFLTKDIRATLTTQKVIDAGTKGATRVLQMNFGNGFSASYRYEWRDGGPTSQPVTNAPAPTGGWVLTSYRFKDGSREGESVLAGTSSRMKDRVSFTGERGRIEITQDRTDIKTGKLLAGVTYRVTWSEPPEVLKPQEKAAFDFALQTVSSSTWRAPQQSAHINQGAAGIYFVAPDGAKFLTKDISATLTTQKVIEAGTKGATRVLQMNFGNGFSASYGYAWR